MAKTRKITVMNEKVLEIKKGKILEIPRDRKIPMGLGYFVIRKTENAGLHLARFSNSSNYSYNLALHLNGDYLIGAHTGKYIGRK